MHRIDLELIRTELSWVNAPVWTPPAAAAVTFVVLSAKPTRKATARTNPTERIWTYRYEYLCARCREYYFGGVRHGTG